MSVGRVGGGGKGGRAGGPKGAGPAAGPAKAGGKTFGKVDRTETLVGPSGAAGSSNVAPADPVTAKALEIARALKSGEIATREEASRRLVAEILKEKLRLKSNSLTSKISDQLQDDPRLNQILERFWSKG